MRKAWINPQDKQKNVKYDNDNNSRLNDKNKIYQNIYTEKIKTFH